MKSLTLLEMKALVQAAEEIMAGEWDDTNGAYSGLHRAAEKLKARMERTAAASCLHELERLAESARPYRYECRKCGTQFKVASGLLVVMRGHRPVAGRP